MDRKKTRVVHCKKEPFDIYIGRPSKWGNPFRIGKDGMREEVIEKYYNWLLKRQELMDSLDELRGKTLGCWCKPKPCHGDAIIKAIELQDGINKVIKEYGDVLRKLTDG